MMQTQQLSGETLSALDADLPFLASEAAVDLETLLGEGTGDFVAIQRLAQRLRNSITPAEAGGYLRSLLDPATLTVLSEAIYHGLNKDLPKNLEDLLAGAQKIAEELSRHDPIVDRAGLERARDFCIALSRAAASYQKSIHDLRPPHPFRR